jgi:hypothetical protein
VEARRIASLATPAVRARAEGVTRRTLEQAKATLAVVAGPAGFQGPWSWSLPASSLNQQPPDFTSRQSLGEPLENPQN